jgi:hypothetical protein
MNVIVIQMEKFFFVDGALEKIDFELLNLPKGCLIPESFPIWLKSPKKSVSRVLSTWRKDAQDRDLSLFFWDLSQSEECSDIKQPLKNTN